MRQNPHVRICGGPGSATTLVYPTPASRWHGGPQASHLTLGGPAEALLGWTGLGGQAARDTAADRGRGGVDRPAGAPLRGRAGHGGLPRRNKGLPRRER